MNLETLNSALRSLITAPELRAVLIDGPWGAGKTYFAKKFAAEKSKVITEAGLRFAYVSLFGASSLAEVRSRLAISYGKGIGWKAAAEKFELPKQILGCDIGSLGKFAKDILEDLSINKLFVCLDDLERAEHKLDVTEVLGLVSELTQDRGCKVLLLLNSRELQRPDRLKAYTEKVFDLELAFNPRPDEVIQIGLQDPKWAAAALPAFQRADYPNIRIMQRVQWVLNEIKALGADIPPTLWAKLVNQAAIICICHYRHRALFGGTLEPMLSWSTVGHLVQQEIYGRSDEKTAPVPWKALLEKFDYDPEPYDGCIIALLQSGTLAPDSTLAAIREAKERDEENSVAGKHAAIWAKYRANFLCTGDDFADELTAFLREHSGKIHSTELLQDCEMLLRTRDTEEARTLAKKCMTPAVEKTPPSRRAAAYESYTHLLKSGVIRGIPFKANERPKTLAELFRKMTDVDGVDPRAFQEFALYPTAELRDVLLTYSEDDIFRRIQIFFETLPMLPDEKARYPAQQAMNRALNAVAKGKPFHKMRIDAAFKKELRHAYHPVPRRPKSSNQQ